MTSRVCRTIRSSVPCKTSPRGGAMLSPLDKQQEHRLRPVECQQEDSWGRPRPGMRIDGSSRGVAAYAHPAEFFAIFSSMSGPMSLDQRARQLFPPGRLSGFLLITALVPMGPAFGQTRHIELNDYAKITSVSDPQISPDGKSIAFVVSRPNLDEDRSDRQLVLLDIATGAQHVLTYERKEVGSPRWSPAGDRLAFVAVDGAGKDAKPQVFILPMTGGEAHKITAALTGVEQFAWRPSGQEIAYVTSDEPENKKEMEKHHDAFEVGDNDYLAMEAQQ